MTVPPTGPHLDLDALAEVEAGIAPPDEARGARAHLDECSDCRDRLARLRTTRALLTTLPSEPMPAVVAARVDAALAAAAGTSTTVVPLSGRRRAWNTPALAGAAAAVAILVLVGAVVVGNRSGHHRTSSTDSAAGTVAPPGPTSAAGIKEWATGRDYSAQTLAASVPMLVRGTPPATLGLGTDATSSTNGSGAASAPGAATPVPAPKAASSGAAATYSQDQLRTSRAAVADCGRILAGGVATIPIAVDFARFDGRPAVVFVLPAAGHPTLVDVWVVRTTCSAMSADLYFRRVPRTPGSG